MKPGNRQQILIIAAISMVALYAADSLILTPLTASWKKRSEDIAQLRKSIRNGDALLQREQATQKRWNEMRKNTLPVNVSHAEQEVLKAFDRWSEEARISVSSLKPQWKRGTSDDFSLLECRVDASGSLQALARFIYEIEKSPMALKIESLELSSRDNDGQQVALGLLVSGLRLAPLERKP